MPPGQSFSYKQYFVIGRGDVAAIRDVFHSVRGTPVGTFGGRVRDRTTLIPVANTSVVVDDASGNPFNQHTTDTNGNFVGNLPPGNYAYRVVDDKYYTQAPVPFTVKQGQTTSADIYVDTPAYITVQVTDERGLAMPAKVSLEGTFPLPPNDPTTGLPLDPRFFLFDLKRGERRRPTALSGDHTDYTARKFLEEQYWTPNGVVGDTSRAGHFTVWVSHGLEYDAYSQDVDLVSGQGVTIAATLHHVVDTTNYVGGDLHLHSMNSIDSGQPVPARVVGLAAEGLEFGVATDHNFITDYSPQVVQYNLQQWFMPVVGIELTTLELGHFNGYPLDYNLATSTHGSFSWFNRPSQSIFDELRSIGKYGPSNTIVQVNHPRDSITGYFNDLNLDPDMAVSQPQFGLIVPQGDPFSPSQFSTDFDALEVFNGKRRDILRTLKVPAVLPASGNYPATDTIPGQPLRTAKGAIAYPGGVDDWFHLLNLGYRFTAMGNSDSHSNNYEEPGFPRTFVRIGTDDPFQIRDLALAQAIKAHKTTMTNCAFVELRVDGNEIGSDMTYHAPSAQVSVRIQKAPWVQIDTLNLYVNSSGDPLVSFPLANLGDQTIDYSLTINRDSWIVAEVTGTQSLWPLVTGIEEPPLTAANAIGTLGATFGIDSNPLGDLTPSLVTPAIPYALTNPIWIDYDGDGQFTPPGNTARVIPASVAAAASLAPAIPVKRKGAQMGDIRVIFRAFSDSHPNGD